MMFVPAWFSIAVVAVCCCCCLFVYLSQSNLFVYVLRIFIRSHQLLLLRAPHARVSISIWAGESRERADWAARHHSQLHIKSIVICEQRRLSSVVSEIETEP